MRDLFETMAAVNGAGWRRLQIGVDLQLVIFGTDAVSPRYPDAPPVPRTVLLNPVITPIGTEEENGRAACRCRPAGWSALGPHPYTGFDPYGEPIGTARWVASMPGWCSTNATT